MLALLVSTPAAAALVDELQARFEAASCRPADHPAHRAAKELPDLRRQAEAADAAPGLLDRLAAAYELVEDYGASQRTLERMPPTLDTLGRIGLMQRARGEPAAAEATLLRCLAHAKNSSQEDGREAIQCRNLLGLAYRDLARYADAERELQAALAAAERALGREHPEAGYGHNLLGTLYMLLGDYARAERHYMRSLEIRAARLGPCSAVTATSLHYLADAYDATARQAQALEARRLSLAMRERVLPPHDHSIGHSFMGLGETLIALGRREEAERAIRRSLDIYLKVYGPRHQRSLRSLWSLARLASGTEQAEPLYAAGLRDSSARDTPEYLWRFQHGYSELLRARGNGAAAAYFGKQAVDTIQGMRKSTAGLERELQSGFLHDKSAVYRGLADLLIGQGRLGEAQQVLAMLKEEELFDFIRRDGNADPRSTRPALNGVEQPWAKRYAQISGELATLGTRREALERKRREGLSAAEQAELKQIEGDAGVARKGFVAFLDELVKESARLDAERRSSLARRDVEGLEGHQDDLKVLGDGAVMLHYVVMPDKVRIILTTADVQLGRAFAIEEKNLYRKIIEFREALQSPARDAAPAARALYEVLVAPVAADLRAAGARTLMLSLDGALRYAPFAALHDGERYLVEDYRIAMLTEAAKSRLTVRGARSLRFAGLGTTRSLPGFDALPAVRGELEGILKVGALEGEVHLDEQFTAERVRETLGRKVGLLHLASHFVFQPGTETDSFLLLGDGSRLSLRDLREAGFNFRGVELLTLSACETALGGGADANGREVEGLGALAQQRGARAVMATLWPVADASTGLLMREFYRLRAGEAELSKAEALRQAQLGLLNKRITHESGVAFSHPFFWAPFILMGNWL